MSRDPIDLLAGLGREVVVAIVTWIGALTTLFVLYGSLRAGLEARARQQGIPVETMQEVLPVGKGPVFAQWTEFVASYSTFDFGVSVRFQEEVTLIFVEAFARSFTLAYTFVAVATVLTVLVLLVTTRLRPGQRGVLAVPSYLLGALAPIVGGMCLLWLAYATGSLPTQLTPPPTTPGGVNGGLLLVVSTVVALPIVGDAVRRAHRQSGAADTLTFDTLFSPGKGGLGTVEVWGYLLYLGSSLVVVEQLFLFQGIGWYLYQAVVANDVPLLLGMAAGLVLVFVVLALLRNVIWAVARYERADPGQPGPPESQAAPPSAGPPPAQPSRGVGISNAVVGNRKVQIGTGVLVVAAILGFVGALAVPVDGVALQRPPVPGLTVGILLNTMASIATGLAVVLLVALVLGVLPGLIAGALEGTDVGPGTVLSTILRLPSEVALVVPFAAAGVLYVMAYPPAGQTGSELAVGTVTGLVLAGFAFRAVYESTSAWIREGTPNAPWVGQSLAAGLSRLDFTAVVTVFVAGELAFLGLFPFGPYVGFRQLDIGYASFSFMVVPGGNVGGALLAVVLAMAPFAIGIYLLGDGLGAVSARFRDPGTPAPSTPQSPRLAPQQSTGQGQAPPQGTPQGQPPRGQPPRGQPQHGEPPRDQPPQNQSQQGRAGPPQGHPRNDGDGTASRE